MCYYYWANKTNGEYKIASCACLVMGDFPHRGFHLVRDIQFSGLTFPETELKLELFEVSSSIGSKFDAKLKVLDMLNGKFPYSHNLRKFTEINFTVPRDLDNFESDNVKISKSISDTHVIYYIKDKSDKWEFEIIKNMSEYSNTVWSYCLPRYWE